MVRCSYAAVNYEGTQKGPASRQAARREPKRFESLRDSNNIPPVCRRPTVVCDDRRSRGTTSNGVLRKDIRCRTFLSRQT